MRAEIRIVEQEEMAIAKQWLNKHLFTAMNAQATIEFEAVG
jgi:hypothetical protein